MKLKIIFFVITTLKIITTMIGMTKIQGWSFALSLFALSLSTLFRSPKKCDQEQFALLFFYKKRKQEHFALCKKGTKINSLFAKRAKKVRPRAII